MEPDRGIAVLRHGRAALLGAALAVAFGAVAPAPAHADQTTPAPGPSQAPTLAPPSQQQIDDAKSALDRMRNAGTTPTSAPTSALAAVSGPTVPSPRRRATSRISDQDWWMIGAGALVLLVLSETTRLSVRRAKHRKA